jgi:HAD superfamily hydrolase (TIGR01450 family)
MPTFAELDRAGAIQRYIDIAHRLPSADMPDTTRPVEHLGQLVDEIDVFVLDGFGVLNVGTDPVPGAVDRINSLREQGKQVLVLTNGATVPVFETVKKYRSWGFEFNEQEVVSSRNALEEAVASCNSAIKWGVVGRQGAQIELLAPNITLLEDDAAAYDQAEAYIFLGSSDWTASRHALLVNSLQRNKRRLLVGNPDLVAPQASGMSLEPGFFSHALADLQVCEPEFYGKPFGPVFDIVARQIDNVPSHRIAMVGDSLHTDILGGAAYGWRTILIKDHGLLKGSDHEALFNAAGIRPDFVADTT